MSENGHETMEKTYLHFFKGITLISALLLQISCREQRGKDIVNGLQLLENFKMPPPESKPRVWWHWMDGNVTMEGIQKDLEWMERTGIGGFQNFDAAFSMPQVVEHRLAYMSPEWKDAFRFTVELANRKGLEMAIAGSPGWSESGGPWVSPEQAMKKIVWSEHDIQGGKIVNETLPAPPAQTGPFQSIEKAHRFLNGVELVPPVLYKDVAVLAIRMPDTYEPLEKLNPKISSSSGKFSLSLLTDGDLSTAERLLFGNPGSKAWVQYSFSSPRKIYAVDLSAKAMSRKGYSGILPALEASNDGQNFHKITDLSDVTAGIVTMSFQPVSATYFRLVWTIPDIGQKGAAGNADLVAETFSDITEFKLYTTPRVNRFVEKAGFAVSRVIIDKPTPEYGNGEVIARNDVIDLTANMAEDGSFHWDAPDGNWKILRFGYSLTGRENVPASPEATGLEVDKLSAKHVREYFSRYLDIYKDASGERLGKQGLQYVITDSWEAGCLNWTDRMFEDFQNLRGYDLHTWLPALVGYVIDSPLNTDKFLFDYRKTLGELVIRNHYNLLTDLLAERGMGRYSESHEYRRACVFDGMEVKKHAAIPMSAMWTTGNTGRSGADIRESSSVAHIYGQKYVAAESLTAAGKAWSFVPETLKPTADWEMANGLNRFVIHTSVHQPSDSFKPGISLGRFGQWFTRHETWAENAARQWMTYLARSCYMLQEGKDVADILYFYGEHSNITALFGDSLPPIPEGYNFDFVNADALLHAIEYDRNGLVSPAGARYRFIFLDPDHTRMITLPILRKLKALVKAGAVVAGNRPVSSPSLVDDPATFSTLVQELWPHAKGINHIGKGKVLGGFSMEEVVRELGLAPDMTYERSSSGIDIRFVHRKEGDLQWYWLLNRTDAAEDVRIRLHISGYEPEVWDAVTGTIVKPSYFMDGDYTSVVLHFDPYDALFVVFRKKTSTTSFDAPVTQIWPLTSVEGPWEVGFKGMGAPARTIFQTLEDWSHSRDYGIRYYSGTATYTKYLQIKPSWIEDGQLWLNLGNVKNIAEVFVNGKPAGLVWRKPFRFNISDSVIPGKNHLEVKVTNTWVNRLIGDAQPGVMPYTRTIRQEYQPNDPLMSSGLLGPVTLEKED